ncbi:MAG: hypothetical protein WD904_05580 [Dehalococcoidia bacterium]
MSRNVGDGGLAMFVLRAWLWFMPISMVAAAVIFGGIAAADGSWGLVAVMLVIGLAGVGLMVLHYWLLYRFGKETRQ